MPIGGAVAFIRWHFYQAAELRNYAIVPVDGAGGVGRGLELTATVVSRDAFKLSQRPLILEVPWVVRKVGQPVNSGTWRWPIVTLKIHENGRLKAMLGPPDERPDLVIGD
jgi:hypothetical protein